METNSRKDTQVRPEHPNVDTPPRRAALMSSWQLRRPQELDLGNNFHKAFNLAPLPNLRNFVDLDHSSIEEVRYRS